MANASQRHLGRDFWRLTKPYWTSDEKWGAWGLLALIVYLTVISVYLLAQLNTWKRSFWDALQNYHEQAAFWLILQFTALALFFVVSRVYAFYLTQMLQLRWRRWLTDSFLDRWLDRHRYYQWHLSGEATDNPDQRIQEDIDKFVDNTLTLGFGLFRETSTLVVFIGILWALSGPFSLRGISIPGYLVWICLIYASIGTWLTHKIGHQLANLNFDQQRFEADFRFGLMRVRENSDGIAFNAGEEAERRSLGSRFTEVLDNFYQIMVKQKQINFFSGIYSQLDIVLPYVVCLPLYLARTPGFGFGGLMQTASAFGQVSNSLSFIVNSYKDIAYWRSVVKRLGGFVENMEKAAAQDADAGDVVGIGEKFKDELAIHDLSLQLPGGAPLLNGVNLIVPKGQATLISGPSGVGKSTLFRSIRGLWPYSEGRVTLPAGARPMILPQQPYLPLNTLRAAMTYPAPASAFKIGPIKELLDLLALGKLADRLDEEANWTLTLSPGEQQRISIMRAFLHKPDWLFLDEATSALDEDMQALIYRALKERLPGTTIISIAHRSSLRDFHQTQFDLGKYAANPSSPSS